jgi:hypothetical protein
LFALPILAVCGCTGGERYAKVSGKVTYNGKPLPGGTVIFANEDITKVERAPVRADGTYSSDKVPYGNLRVGVEPAAKSPTSMMPKGMKLPPGAPNAGPTEGQYVDIPKNLRDPAKSGRTVTIDSPEKTYDIDLK